MAASSETIVLASTASGWVAAVLSIVADTHELFHRFPVIGFIMLGMIGGFAGWALLIEVGKLDELSPRQSLYTLMRRTVLGAVMGVFAAVWWSGSNDSKSLYMLLGGAAAIFPVEFTAAALSRLRKAIIGFRSDR